MYEHARVCVYACVCVYVCLRMENGVYSLGVTLCVSDSQGEPTSLTRNETVESKKSCDSSESKDVHDSPTPFISKHTIQLVILTTWPKS